MYFELWYEFCLCHQQVDIARGKGDKYKYHKLKNNTFVAVLDVIFPVITSQLVFNVYKYK